MFTAVGHHEEWSVSPAISNPLIHCSLGTSRRQLGSNNEDSVHPYSLTITPTQVVKVNNKMPNDYRRLELLKPFPAQKSRR